MAIKKINADGTIRKSVKQIEKELIKKVETKSKRKKNRKNKIKKPPGNNAKNEYGLTPKRTNFCQIFVVKGNATEAYLESGYKATKSVARVESSKLLTIPKIQVYIKYLMEKAEDEAIAKPKEILEFLTQVARGEIPDQWSDKPSVKDRMEAVKLLGKRHGLFNDKVEVAIGGKIEHVHRPAVADELIETMFVKPEIIDGEVTNIKQLETESEQVS